MKIFTAPRSVEQPDQPRPSKKSNKAKSEQVTKNKFKPQIGQGEIKAKLQKHLESEGVEKELRIKNSKKLGEGFLNSDQELPIGDVGLNDPLDTNTQEKLKTVLSKGAFNFNNTEKAVLEKILS